MSNAPKCSAISNETGRIEDIMTEIIAENIKLEEVELEECRDYEEQIDDFRFASRP